MTATHPTPWSLRRTIAFCLAGFLSAAVLPAQSLRSGTIEGRVLNQESGKYLPKARVTVKDSTLETFTNENGEYRLPETPAGSVTVTVTFTGLEPQTRTVPVAAGQPVRLDITLALPGQSTAHSEVVKLEAFTVEERELTAQSAALHEQRSAANIKNVVSFEEFGDLGITNPGHFLVYIPGVTNVYNTTGEVEGIGLRGMPSSSTLVMFDGTQAATNLPASRGYDFLGTSTANLERIEVTKVPTPDLPANAVGGSINMVSKSGFNRSTPLFRYHVFTTLQAKGSHGNLNDGLGKYAGPDGKTTIRPIQPGFEASYLLPLNKTLAFTFNAGHNARLQDREYVTPTWDRIRFVQTSGTMNSVLNVFTKDDAAVGADWKVGSGVVKARLDYTLLNAYARQSAFTYNFGAGATGGENFTRGAATGVGSVGQTLGRDYNQYRTLLNARLQHVHEADRWKFDWSAAYSGATRKFSDVDDGLFGGVNASLPNLVLSGQRLDAIQSVAAPDLTARSRTGEVVDPYDVRAYTLSSVSSDRRFFKNEVFSLAANVSRRFDTRLPVTVKVGASMEKTDLTNWTEPLAWNFRPPATAGGQIVGNHNLLADGYSARRGDVGNVRLQWLSGAKTADLYRQHPEYFQLNEVSAHTGRVNNSKKLQETISAGYLRTDLKALENRLWIVAGARLERTADEGRGPLNDIRATYVKNARGEIVYDASGRPVPLTTDPLAVAKLQFRELGARSEKSYEGLYPSFNASYAISSNWILRAAYAGTIGRPELSFVIPGTSITDPTSASRAITVVNTGLKPWTADNYDLTLESYEMMGATVSVSGFRKKITDFFTQVRVPASQDLLDRYSLPTDLLTGDYEIITQENSADHAILSGLELSWRQSLRTMKALPSWARPFGLFANGTYLRIGGPGRDAFTGYSTRIINWGFNYTRGNLGIKLSATSSNGPRTSVVAANATTPAGTYTGLAPRTLIGGSVEYRFNKRLAVQLSGQNLSNAQYRNMTFAPGAPLYTRPTQFRDNGIEYVVGVKGEF